MPGVRVRKTVIYPSSWQGRCAGSLQKQGTDRPIPSPLPGAICRGSRSGLLFQGSAVETKPAELHQPPGSTESFRTKPAFPRFCLPAALRSFVCSGGRKFVLLEPGCCHVVSFVLSLSCMDQREDGTTLCPCSPEQLAGSPPESWGGLNCLPLYFFVIAVFS